MEEGTIAGLNERGFGFIKRPNQSDEEKKDLFFHKNELQGVQFEDLAVGDKLSYEVAEGPKGLNAVNVSRV